MEQLNRIELRGNVGTVKYVADGNPPYAHFSLATSKAYRGKAGEAIIETTWHNVVAFEGKYIKGLDKLERGSKVSVTGRLKNNRFTGADGLEKSVLDVIASELTFIDSREPLECEM
ncbi:MAG: single-stranded DNA-binding protein [Bacteroidales bacterium]|nr:single-stranded DNA-binding protein [Bacteroidales bacterium]